MVDRADRAQMAVWAVAAVLLALAAYRWLGADGEAAGRSPPIRVEGAGDVDRSPGRGVRHYVHVAGAVRRPGLVRVAPGARVGSAVARAGGHTSRADLTRINLAAKVSDGQQVIVPRRGEAVPAAGPGTAREGGAGAAAQVGLGSATVEQLDSLDGIGPTLARRIVEERDRRGGFRSVDELREVDGIGEKRLEALREALVP